MGLIFKVVEKTSIPIKGTRVTKYQQVINTLATLDTDTAIEISIINTKYTYQGISCAVHKHYPKKYRVLQRNMNGDKLIYITKR